MALINEGLQPGERVVVDGQYKLQPGARVKLPAPAEVDSVSDGKAKPEIAAPPKT
jgi:multidrug efflux system membrane fusion protein